MRFMEFVLAELSSIQIIVIMGVSIFLTLFQIWEIKGKIKRRCKNKKLRNLPYFKKNWFKKIFLVGIGDVIEIEVFICNAIDKILFVLLLITGVLNLIFSINIFSIILKILLVLQLILWVVVGKILLPYWHYKDPKEKR